MRLWAVLLIALLAGPVEAKAQSSRASLDEARALAEAASRHIQDVGSDAAFHDFEEASDPRWFDRDLYVVIVDHAGVVLAHGLSPSLTGRSTLAMRDVDGKPFVREIVAQRSPGWVHFKYLNPVSGLIEPKVLYVLPADAYQITVGAYVPFSPP